MALLKIVFCPKKYAFRDIFPGKDIFDPLIMNGINQPGWTPEEIRYSNRKDTTGSAVAARIDW